MSTNETRILLPQGGPVESLEAYRAMGGCEAYEVASRTPPQAMIEELGRSGLRGRGGAEFPTSAKWASVADDPAETKYVCCNGGQRRIRRAAIRPRSRPAAIPMRRSRLLATA